MNRHIWNLSSMAAMLVDVLVSPALAQEMQKWLAAGRDLCVVIGGADGLALEIKKRADLLWSLSPLTLAHAMVRVLLAEQLYRAYSILQNHPYHRD